MKPPIIGVLALAAGCAAKAPVPTPISKVDDSGPRLAIAETRPPRGSEIDALTQSDQAGGPLELTSFSARNGAC
jgi:hypothetical protein